MSGMEADDLDDSLCGGAKCDRENSDCAQLESRNRDKTKVTVNMLCHITSVKVIQWMQNFLLARVCEHLSFLVGANSIWFFFILVKFYPPINFCDEILQVPPWFRYCSQSSHTRVKVMTLVTLGWGQVFWRKFWHRKNWFV